MLQEGTILGDRYEIIKKIGSGGMSIVYKAKCNKLNRYVAIKVLREEFVNDETFVSKFKVEAQSAASLAHENIVNIYDVGFDKGLHYIVMEYINGVTLKDFLREKGPISSKQALDIGIQIAKGLQLAHENHIIHRDIKPQNIMVTTDGKIKVTDFGIARAATSSTITVNSNILGSVHYFSPEQARGGYIDEKSDIYSMGITLYEIVTNTLPFQAESPVSIALQHLKDELPKPSVHNSEIWTSLESIIIKATQKKPELRYASAEEMIEDMKKALQDPAHTFDTVEDYTDYNTIKLSEEDIKNIRDEVTDSDYAHSDHSSLNKPADRKKEQIVIAGAIFTSILIIGIIFIFGVQWINNLIHPKPELVDVPPVIGLTYDDAKALLGEFDLGILKAGEQFDDEIEEGKILTQDPEAETEIEAGSTVEINISKGSQKVDVPNVLNKEFKEAEDIIEKKGFHSDIKSEYNPNVPIGVIFKQDPEPGDLLLPDETVVLTASLGKEVKKVKVPDVRNTPVDEAIAKLKEAGLVEGNITYVEHSSVEKDKVISQTVTPGEEVTEGYIIDLAVSKGIKQYVRKVSITDILNSTKEKGVIEIVLNQDGKSTLVEQVEVTHDSFPVEIPIKGRGIGKLEIYLDGNLEFQKDINFEESIMTEEN